MGLKTKNYRIEKLDITLPEAYAVIINLHIKGGTATATFAIQTSRSNAMGNKEPIVTKELAFKVNRNENPYTTAYKLAKSQGVYKDKVINGIFYGWEDDILTV